MAPIMQRQIARLGGKTAHERDRGHEWTRAEAKAAGRQVPGGPPRPGAYLPPGQEEPKPRTGGATFSADRADPGRGGE